MKKSQVEITTVKNNREMRELISLFRLGFGSRDAILFLKFHGREPIYRRNYSKVVKLDNKIVSHILVIPHFMRIGLAVVKVGVIGYTVTHPDYRRRGLATILMNKWIEEMTNSDYCLSYVFGIPYFYQQFGYEFAFFGDNYSYEPATYMNVGKIKRKKMRNKFVANMYEEKELSSISKLYNHANRERTGALIRTKEYWKWLIKGLNDSGRIKRRDIVIIKDNTDQLLGYAIINSDDQNLFAVWEIATMDANEKVFAFLIRAIISRAQEQGVKSIYFKLPLNHPFLRYCVAMGAIPTGYSYRVYARVINLSLLFHTIIPELERRLSYSSFKNWEGRLRVKTDIGSITLNIVYGTINCDNNDKKVCSLLYIPQNLLIQLITGYTDVARIASNWKVKIVGGDLQLWQALFPKLYPYIWAADGGY